MKFFISSFILLAGLIVILAETGESVVYYVSPTKALPSCSKNSSCTRLTDQCYTMDYLSEHRSEFFSPDHTNVTLIFMCGVHNYTKDLTVHNLHSFVMKGTEESRSDVIINHQFTGQCGKPSCTIIQLSMSAL